MLTDPRSSLDFEANTLRALFSEPADMLQSETFQRLDRWHFCGRNAPKNRQYRSNSVICRQFCAFCSPVLWYGPCSKPL